MFAEHAREIKNKLDEERTSDALLSRAKASVSGFFTRTTPADAAMRKEIMDLTKLLRESGAVDSQVEQIRNLLKGPPTAEERFRRLSDVLRSKHLLAVSHTWINARTLGKSLDLLSLKSVATDWSDEFALSSHNDRSINDHVDASALSYVDNMNVATKGINGAWRTSYVIAAPRVFSAFLRIKPQFASEDFFLRHPLSLLPQIALSNKEEFEGLKDCADFLQRFLEVLYQSQLANPAFFRKICELAFGNGQAARHLISRMRRSNLHEQLIETESVCAKLIDGIALRLTADAVGVESNEEGFPQTNVASTLELVQKLRWAEQSYVDSLLTTLTTGVLSSYGGGIDGDLHQLPSQADVSHISRSLRRVPYLRLEECGASIQHFADTLRNGSLRQALDSEALVKIRSEARQDSTGYTELVVNALTLAAFEEWGAARNMAQRAVERARVVLDDNINFKEWLTKRSQAMDKNLTPEKLEQQIKFVKGVEAGYLYAHILRFVARNEADLLEANTYLQECLHKEPNDARLKTESFAIELSRWCVNRYFPHLSDQKNPPQIEYVIDAIIDFHNDQFPGVCLGPLDKLPSAMERATSTFVWEQLTVNALSSLLDQQTLGIPLSDIDYSGWTRKASQEISRHVLVEKKDVASAFLRFIALISEAIFQERQTDSWTDKIEITKKELLAYQDRRGATLLYDSKRAKAFLRLVGLA